MHPARMVVHATCQDGCLCHTALSRSVTGRLGVTRGLRPFITLFVHFPFLLVSPYIFVLVRPFIMLFVHFPFCITCLSFSESVYYAICPFSLSRLILIHVILLERPFPFLISYPYSSEAFYYAICPINLAFLFFLLARPFIMLFVHFLFLITSLSFSESVYRAIRPFGFSITCLSSSELVS